MDKRHKEEHLHAASEPGLALKGCCLPDPGLVHFNSSAHPVQVLSTCQSITLLSLTLSWFKLVTSCQPVHPSRPFFVVTFPLSHSGAAASPTTLPWLLPSLPYKCRHRARAGMSIRSCFLDATGSKTRSETMKNSAPAANPIYHTLNAGIKNIKTTQTLCCPT